ncbi:MAG TPA: tol-pal system protein YbgF, partial [Candidatus Cloacimonadota bacterium]|nr:tol-pal system protein YbgF [Candidatus Cloacimonadota bacterium]
AQRKEMEAEIAALRQAMNQSATPATKPTAMQTTHTAADLGVDAEREVYEAARMEYNNGNYDKAIEMLDAFIAQYPNSDYAGNASYWKGESRYAKSEWAAALKEFQAVVTRYPGSWKEADSQLKIGMCHLNMGNNSEARAALNNLKRQYPYYGRMDLVNSYLNQLN